MKNGVMEYLEMLKVGCADATEQRKAVDRIQELEDKLTAKMIEYDTLVLEYKELEEENGQLKKENKVLIEAVMSATKIALEGGL